MRDIANVAVLYVGLRLAFEGNQEKARSEKVNCVARVNDLIL